MSRKLNVLFAKVEDNYSWSRFKFAPLGLMYIANAAEKAGLSVRIWHGPRYLLSQLYALARQTNPIYVGFSTHTMGNLKATVEASRRLHGEGFTVVWGGVHATIMPDLCLDGRYVDYVVRREGEEAAPDLALRLATGRDGASLRGVSVRGGIGGYTDRISDLDEYEPRWGLVDAESYLVPAPWADRVLPVVASRGCPHRCGFCFSPQVYRRYMVRHSYGWLDAHIDKLIARYGIDGVSFRDENLFANPRFGRRVASMMHDKGLRWYVPIRADTLADTDQLPGFMAEHGCRAVYIGAESGSQRMLNVMQKGITVSQIWRAVASFEGTDVHVGVGFIYGLPGEEEKDRGETFDLIDELHGLDVQLDTDLACYTPYPATSLWERALAEGLEPPSTDVGWSLNRIDVPKILPWVSENRYHATRLAMRAAHCGRLRGPLGAVSRLRWRRRFFSLPVEGLLMRGYYWMRGER